MKAMEEETTEEGGLTSNVGARHIKKRALKNKALSVSFNEKDLTDFVSGFHKRKKKRRKEAQHLQQEALRRKRIELRAKRKLEREYVIYGDGGAPPDADAEPAENGEDDDEDDDEIEPQASVSGTMTYDNGDMKVLVRTSEISQEDDLTENLPRLTTGGSEKKHSVPVVKRKPFKKVVKKRSRPKQQTKRDKRKGNQKSKE